jgi:Uma2 family endonuclease
MNNIPVPFAPDIAIEVISPSESAIDVNRKVLDYLAGGSQEVWLIDHLNREIFVPNVSGIRLFRGNDPVESKLLPGFSPAVNDLIPGRYVR